jgi:hypothetical protein
MLSIDKYFSQTEERDDRLPLHLIRIDKEFMVTKIVTIFIFG